MKIENTLEEIGLTRNEAILYLTLLKLGTTKTGPLIKESKLHSSKVYDGLERLQEKGLVSYIIESNVKHFTAVEPKRLLDFLEEKKRKIESQKNEIKNIIPYLENQQKIEDTKAEIFRGWNGMETVYRMLRDTLKKGDMNYVFGASRGEDEEKVKDFFEKHLSLMAKKGIKQRIIYNESARGNIPENQKHPQLFQVRHLEHTTPAEINIWKDTIMIVVLSKNPTIIFINDKKVAESFKQYFDVMWKLAKQ